MTTLLDLLKKELVGKNLELLKCEFKYNKDSEIDTRLFMDTYLTNQEIKRDKRLKKIGLVQTSIIELRGYSDQYEGDNIYIVVEYAEKRYDINVNILDEINIWI